MLSRGTLLSVAFWVVFLGAVRVAVIPPEDCGRTDETSLRQAAEQAIGWIKRNQQTDGSYVYLYYSGTDTTPPEYNDVRHAGVTLALYEAADRLNDAEALSAADRGLAWMQANLVRRHDWAALSLGGDPSLGGSALMLVGLNERRLDTGDHRYYGVMHELARYIVALQRPDGGFSISYSLANDAPDPEGTSPYFPGEALWALALTHEAFPGEGWDTHARSALDYIATRRDDFEGIDFPPFADQWAAYGLAEMSGWGLTDQEIDYAHRLAERFGLLVRTESQREAGWLGRLVRGHDSRAAGMGTWVEGLAGLWRLAVSDPRMADVRDKVLERDLCAAGILAARQVRADEARTYVRPGLAEGAWFRGGETRMDDQQHAFSGLLYALDALHGNPQRAPTGPASSP